jgi:hypothetical protein
MRKEPPNKLLQPTPVGAGMSAFADHVTGPVWLSFCRWAGKHFMKSSIVMGIMVVSLLTGCDKQSGAQKEVPPYRGPTFTQSTVDDFVAERRKVADQSQVIAYASADTNNLPSIVFTVSEIWKGTHDATTLGVTNGTQFTLIWNSQLGLGLVPDGAIVLIPQAVNSTEALQKKQMTFVRSGRILNMTVKEFRSRLEL